MTHELKCWPIYFDAIDSGMKTFEARRNDRDYQLGDVLILNRTENNGATNELDETTLPLKCVVTYILHGPGFGIEAGYCVMAIQRGEQP